MPRITTCCEYVLCVATVKVEKISPKSNNADDKISVLNFLSFLEVAITLFGSLSNRNLDMTVG